MAKQININKVYTRTGDDGRTNLADGSRVFKSCLSVDQFGIADELNSHIGLLCVLLEKASNNVIRYHKIATIFF